MKPHYTRTSYRKRLHPGESPSLLAITHANKHKKSPPAAPIPMDQLWPVVQNLLSSLALRQDTLAPVTLRFGESADEAKQIADFIINLHDAAPPNQEIYERRSIFGGRIENGKGLVVVRPEYVTSARNWPAVIDKMLSGLDAEVSRHARFTPGTPPRAEISKKVRGILEKLPPTLPMDSATPLTIEVQDEREAKAVAALLAYLFVPVSYGNDKPGSEILDSMLAHHGYRYDGGTSMTFNYDMRNYLRCSDINNVPVHQRRDPARVKFFNTEMHQKLIDVLNSFVTDWTLSYAPEALAIRPIAISQYPRHGDAHAIGIGEALKHIALHHGINDFSYSTYPIPPKDHYNLLVTDHLTQPPQPTPSGRSHIIQTATRALERARDMSIYPHHNIEFATKHTDEAEARAFCAAMVYANHNDKLSAGLIKQSLDELLQANGYRYDPHTRTSYITIRRDAFLPGTSDTAYAQLTDMVNALLHFKGIFWENGDMNEASAFEPDKIRVVIAARPEYEKQMAQSQAQLVNMIGVHHGMQDAPYYVASRKAALRVIQNKGIDVPKDIAQGSAPLSKIMAFLREQLTPEVMDELHKNMLAKEVPDTKPDAAPAQAAPAATGSSMAPSAPTAKQQMLQKLLGPLERGLTMLEQHAPHDRKEVAAMLAEGIRSFAGALDPANALHQALAQKLLKSTNVRMAAHGAGLPKQLGEISKAEQHIHERDVVEFTAFLQENPEQLMVVYEQAVKHPGVLLLMQAAFIRSLDHCKNENDRTLAWLKSEPDGEVAIQRAMQDFLDRNITKRETVR